MEDCDDSGLMCPIVSGTGDLSGPSYPGLKGRKTVVVVIVIS